MSLFNTVDFTAQKYDTTRVDHEFVNTPDGSPFSFSGTFQPTSGNQTQVLPESLRSQKTFRIYTDIDLLCEGDKSKSYHHVTHLDTGVVYKIVYSHPWDNLILDHRKYLAQELKENDG